MKTTFIKRLTAHLFVSLALAVPAVAESYSIDWFTIDGGGGAITGGVYAVNGTIGQPDAGTLNGGGFDLTGGFWSFVTAIQTPAPPFLKLTRTGNNVIASWPGPATGFVLDQTSTLTGAPPPWTQVPFPYQTNTSEIFMTVPSPAGIRFYRLRGP